MSSSPIRPISSETVGTWDFEADVVIAGYGIAGVSAAIGAAENGADVLVLERTGGGGGAAALSGGIVYLGGGTRVQKACGFDDTPENMKTFLAEALGPGVDQDKLDVYCDGSVQHFEWLEACGVRYKESFWSQPGWECPVDDSLMYSGGENAAPFDTLVPPAPRGHLAQVPMPRNGEQGAGHVLMTTLIGKATDLGVRVESDIRVQRLVVDGTGRVVGVTATRFGQEITVRAHGGVVLATGSFAYNDEMMQAYAPRLYKRPAATVEEHDGRAILMAQALGAGLAHMDACEVAFFCDPQLMARGILVNGRGQRYVPEDTYPGRIGQLTMYQNDNQAFLVLDEAAYEEGMAAPSSSPQLRRQPTWVCESVAELESEMGLPEGTLTATVELYNRHAAAGTDPVFGKKPEWVKPIGSPIAAIDLRGMTGGFTLGGLRTSVDSEVLHVDGDPIPGLYAAGRCTSGLSAGGYCSGISLGDGSFFGRRAGISAAATG
ncbi:FAD-dependent oxidoreductase [Rhodococcus sp. (in: high G+C Gram-positive bacteria)]|uniref:FAD-dependent oxidoreductase n=2 Tax=Rhodococcus sp. TaxID=1831 RepID=UPI0019F548C2|nr:FAD-dependent oxidoreductase [Rhodococcus sp. (in: high G+C Gram-positive bacteria)]MBF0661518.1 FAD-dependent oxidoreductase [Rhodococcus sp. (in: high G+C Gram-positive bacteria)]